MMIFKISVYCYIFCLNIFCFLIIIILSCTLVHISEKYLIEPCPVFLNFVKKIFFLVAFFNLIFNFLLHDFQFMSNSLSSVCKSVITFFLLFFFSFEVKKQNLYIYVIFFFFFLKTLQNFSLEIVKVKDVSEIIVTFKMILKFLVQHTYLKKLILVKRLFFN